jgi:general secretion pathway protein C
VGVFSLPKEIDVALETRGRQVQGGLESPMAVVPSGIGEKLGIKLLGTVSGSKALAHAIIRDAAKGQEMPYRVSDTIKGAKIVAIEPLEVIFEYEGRRQALKMDLEYEQSWVFKENPGATRTQEDKKDQINTFGVSKEEIERALQNPEGLNQEASLLPAFKSGKRNGLMIVKITQGSILRKLGLKEGDILQEIDSRPLDLGFRPFALLKETQQKGEVTLSVERRLSPLRVRIRLR